MTELNWQKSMHVLLKILYRLVCHNQVSPDGSNCEICGDVDHQATECRFNAFNLWRNEKS